MQISTERLFILCKEILLMINNDFISNFMPFPLKIRDLKKNAGWTDQRTKDQPRTDPRPAWPAAGPWVQLGCGALMTPN